VLNYLCRLEFVNAIKAARLRYCISQAMCTQYQERYGFEFSALHNGINPEQWSEKNIEPRQAGEPFRILYSGSISENGNLQSLKEVAEAVAGLGAGGVPIRMEVATHTSGFSFRQVIERPPYVTVCDLVPYADLPRRLQEVDLLLIALNFDDVSSRWLRYSMLGKVAEYMISGTPVMLYGPPTNASIDYAVSEEWGYAVTNRGEDSIQAALKRLIAEDGLRRNLASNARRIALRDHDITRMRRDFQSAVCRTAFS
jgi:glycosyltransferase involved in cell wall biosynthesis